jgi:hypothetical protein
MHPELRHQPSADVLVMEITANSQLLDLDFIRSTRFAGPGKSVILRMVEIIDIVAVKPELARKGLCVQGRFLGPAVAVQPAEVGECERLRGFIFFRRGFFFVKACLLIGSEGLRSKEKGHENQKRSEESDKCAAKPRGMLKS